MNNDLISREALLEEFDGAGFLLEYVVRAVISRHPAVDAVEVVRCKDCKNYRGGVCTKITYIMDRYYDGTFEMKSPDDFCSSGEKMDGDVNVG